MIQSLKLSKNTGSRGKRKPKPLPPIHDLFGAKPEAPPPRDPDETSVYLKPEPAAEPPLTEQAFHKNRVSSAIAQSIIAFWKVMVRDGKTEFHNADLLAFISARHPVAPDSPGRILRDLRERGVLDYKIVNRRKSLYRITK